MLKLIRNTWKVQSQHEPPPPTHDESQPTLTGAIMWDISLPATTQNSAVSLPADFGEKYSSN
jgi:hypothetical protein